MKSHTSRSLSLMLLIVASLTVSSCGGAALEYNSDVNYPLAPPEIRSIPLKTLDGEEFRISERKGKVLLLNFWATWCIPCIEEMPHLVELQKELGSKGFEVLGMNTEVLTYEDEGQTLEEVELKIRALMKEQNLNYEVVWTSKEAYETTAKLARFPGIPLSLMLDADGKVIGVFTGAGKETIEKMKQTARAAVEARESRS